MEYDVVIIGGGPAGATAGCLLKKYNPALKVGIFEREVFPRDHVGESQLPPISQVLEEMGCWDKVEAANFPIKIGATYRWGKTPELWDFDFILTETFREEPRPGKYQGQRLFTAFQVDRSIYDEILLDHAAETGCEVHEGSKVQKVNTEGDSVTSLTLDSGETVTGRYYIDASGHSGIIRRALNVPADYPTSLQNIAIWDYWQNADWAVEIGVGGTRIQIMSLQYGWIWFIPLGPTRTSIGLVIPAEYYKKSGKRPAELYEQGLKDDERITGLLRNATCEKKLMTTKDWSFLSSRQTGENWFLVGESAGFADPILSAGMTLAHVAAKEVAYTILELERSKKNEAWLKAEFANRQTQRIKHHIRFADYWYTANAQFVDLKEFTTLIAKDADLEMTPENAWQWLGQGGFINEDLGTGPGGYSLSEIKQLGQFMSDLKPVPYLKENNVFRLDLSGATYKERARYANGRVTKTQAYVRGDRVLPVEGAYEFLVNLLQLESRIQNIVDRINDGTEKMREFPEDRLRFIHLLLQSFEGMISDGWVIASHDPAFPLIDLTYGTTSMHWNTEAQQD